MGVTATIKTAELLDYNGRDCCATWYVAEKHWPTLIAEDQLDCYSNIMKPSVKSLLAMELCGMPINPVKVQEAKKQLSDITEGHLEFFRNNHHIKEVHYQLLVKKAEKCTAKAKKKIYTPEDSAVRKDLEEFNPGSGNQVQYLLYDYFGLPVIEETDTKLPATGGKVLKKLVNHTDNQDIIEIIEHLTGYADASKILSTFIPAFENAQQLPDGSWRLFGNINLGGTQSLRPASNSPNLLNLPSGSIYGKLVKACFEPAAGWLFVGSDFDSLESKINALLTRDENQMSVYTDGFDGHSLRAFYYFRDQMPDIRLVEENSRLFEVKTKSKTHYIKCGTVVKCPNGHVMKIEEYFDNNKQEEPLLILADSEIKELSVKEYNMQQINSIKHKYPELRQKSKAP